MSIRKADNPELFESVQEKKLLRQYDLLLNCIEIGLEKGIEAFDKYTLWSLNAAAVANIAQFGGRYREEPIYVGNHIPPHFRVVPDQMDRFFSVIHENWTVMTHPTLLPAYSLWRMNWIHPFVEGTAGQRGLHVITFFACVRGAYCQVPKLFQSVFARIASPTMKRCEPLTLLGRTVTLTSASWLRT